MTQAPDISMVCKQPPRCDHLLIPQDDAKYSSIYPYRCSKCPAKFSACEVDVVDGELRMHDFTVKKGKRGARRRSSF